MVGIDQQLTTFVMYGISMMRAKSVLKPIGPPSQSLSQFPCNMNWQGVSLLPPGRDASSCRGSPPIAFHQASWQFAVTHLYSWVESGTVRVECLPKKTTHWPGKSEEQFPKDTASWPTVGWQFLLCFRPKFWLTVSQHSADSWWPVGHLSVTCWWVVNWNDCKHLLIYCF